VEKNLEVTLNWRFKRQGRRWNPVRAERLLPPKRLMNHERAWTAWWRKPCAL